MALKQIRIGNIADAFQYDDADYATAIDTSGGGIGDTEIDDLEVSGDRIYMPNIKSGTTQLLAGALAGELWADTNDNYIIKLGV